MQKLFSGVLLALALVFSATSFAAAVKEDPMVAHVQVAAKNQVKAAKSTDRKARGTFETRIRVANETFHTLTVYTGGDPVPFVIRPGYVKSFYYGLLSDVIQPMTIYSDDGALIFNRYVYDEAYLRVTAIEYSNATVYTVYG